MKKPVNTKEWEPLIPAYSQKKIGEEIALNPLEATIKVTSPIQSTSFKNKFVKKLIYPTITFSNRPSLKFLLPHGWHENKCLPSKLEVTFNKIKTEPKTVTAFSFGDSETHEIYQLQKEGLLIFKKKKVNKIIFHLLNFTEFYSLGEEGVPLINNPKGWTIGFVKFEYFDKKTTSNWKIRIQQVDNYNAVKKAIKLSGGYQITHIGEISQTKKIPFDFQEGFGELKNISHFLSFLKGGLTSCFLPVGFNERGEALCNYAHGPFYCSQNPSTTSWFVFDQASVFQSIYPAFRNYLKDPNWKEVLEFSIYLLCNANDRKPGFGTESGIFLTQAALEKLFYVIQAFPNKSKSLGMLKCSSNSAGQNISALLQHCGISVSSEGYIPNFEILRTTNGHNDLAISFTAMRNDLIHAKENLDYKNCKNGPPYFEALTWSLWAIELVILRLCDYQGHYWDRRKVSGVAGEKMNVPWAKRAEKI